ncbi:MAG: ATP-dependent DNA helicase RecG [Clostridiales bacterium]|nr:ATP-dependent DNA helicase RecG [Clostridiales bacterium]
MEEIYVKLVVDSAGFVLCAWYALTDLRSISADRECGEMMSGNAIERYSPLSILPGVGTKKATLFAKLGLNTIQDLLYFFPRDYEDWSERHSLQEAVDGQLLTVEATVAREPTVQRKGRLTIVRARLEQEGAVITAIWFNQPWIRDQLKIGADYVFHGQAERKGRFFNLQNPAYLPKDKIDFSFRPIYPLTQGLTQRDIRQAMTAALRRLRIGELEPLPASLRKENKLCTLEYALQNIHYPDNRHDILVSRERLGFDELFLLQMGLRLIKKRHQDKYLSPKLSLDAKIDDKLQSWLRTLPFRLTADQNQAVADLRRDLEQEKSMNRLIQGDVGSGKTVVAAYGMALTAWSGYQSVFMAPTSILAEQHYETLSALYTDTGLNLALLTGAVRKSERSAILAGLADGTIDILIGTHAVLEEAVKYNNLGLCITDEQHRFGVDQRASLGDFSGNNLFPHMLVMSATPIPRTLALIIYGDLDITLIRQKPPGRVPVATYTAREKDRGRVEKLMRRRIEQNEQVYVVCPMIEDSSEQDLESATGVYNYLPQTVFPEQKVALLHGRLTAKAKSTIMEDFGQGKIDILVTTTVIEVGVDNPQATMMVIENAERFGLAQLHQLRGRIGRGEKESLCVLMSETTDAKARQRLTALCLTNDGFALAEEDLKLRGPGDFFGIRQHGLPEFKIVNLYEDKELILKTSSAADKLLQDDPDLTAVENRRLLPFIKRRLTNNWEPVL